MTELRVKFLDDLARLPTVVHRGEDIAFDLYALEDIVLEPGMPIKVRTGIAVEFSEPGVGFIFGDRSSMATRGVIHGGGRIDAGYRGELLVCLINVRQPEYSIRIDKQGSTPEIVKSDVSYQIRAGDKIIQMSPFTSKTNCEIVLAQELTNAARGDSGFGSSGR